MIVLFDRVFCSNCPIVMLSGEVSCTRCQIQTPRAYQVVVSGVVVKLFEDFDETKAEEKLDGQVSSLLKIILFRASDWSAGTHGGNLTRCHGLLRRAGR